MKILFLSGRINQIGGIERVTLDVANILSKIGHEVHILSYSKSRENLQFKYPQNVKIEYLISKPRSIRYAITKGFQIKKKVKAFKPDYIIYVDSILFLFFKPFISKKYKQIVWEHFNATVTFGTRLRSLSRYWAAKRADACVVLTKEDAQLWEEFFSPRSKIKVIPNPIREDLLEGIKEPLLPILQRKKQVLFVGRLEPQKNVLDLIEIWSKLEANNLDWKLVLVGDGSQRNLIEDKIQSYNLKNVKLMGKVNDVLEFYRDSQILVGTSIYEGFPLVLIEGLFVGLPEISYDCPMGPSSIINNSQNGFLIPLKDKSLFAEKLQLLLTDDKMREDFSNQSLALKNEYLPHLIAEEWTKLFNQI